MILFIKLNSDSPATFKAAGHHSRDISAVYNWSKRRATHCPLDKHLVRPIINRKEQKEPVFLPCGPGTVVGIATSYELDGPG